MDSPSSKDTFSSYVLLFFIGGLILNLGNFLFEYNHLRRHGGLDYKTPSDKLKCVTELLS
jgi:transposase InsO family protein